MVNDIFSTKHLVISYSCVCEHYNVITACEDLGFGQRFNSAIHKAASLNQRKPLYRTPSRDRSVWGEAVRRLCE